jgi:hypothetical protein
MAGYTGGSEVVLAAGLAGTLASALSMGAGAYLVEGAARSLRIGNLARAQGDRGEPGRGTGGANSSTSSGFSAEEARDGRAAAKAQAIPARARQEELGLSEETFPNPLALDALGDIVDGGRRVHAIIPFFFAVGMPAVVASFIISTVAHFAVGAAKSIVTTRSWWASGAEMTAVGIIEAAVTYSLGLAFAGHPLTP